MFSAAITFQRQEFRLVTSLALKEGSITALLGASGSGKSTLFRLLSGLEKPQTGNIYSNGVCWFEAEKKINLSVQKRKVGMVFQDYALFEHLNVFENVAYGVEPAKQKKVVNDWLKKVNLTHKASCYPLQLSGGEKQRVALARALATEPDILMLDEPFSALDGYLRHELRRELQSVISHTKIPVLIATHDLNEARFLADTAYVMSEGEIIQSGTISQLFKNPKTIQAARVLGWQNILPVSSSDECYLRGTWGSLKLNNDCKNVAALAIPIDAISIMHSKDSNPVLSAQITHRVDMGSYTLLEVKLEGNNQLVLHTNLDNCLSLGERIYLSVNSSKLLTFNLDSAVES